MKMEDGDTRVDCAPNWLKHFLSHIAACRQFSRLDGIELTLGIDINLESACDIVSNEFPWVCSVIGRRGLTSNTFGVVRFNNISSVKLEGGIAFLRRCNLPDLDTEGFMYQN
jgi:hypothetical protein